MLDEHCALLFSNSRLVQDQSKLQNTLQGKAIAPALCFLVGQKIKSLLSSIKDMTNFLIPTAEPFYFPGGPTGCLLVHGFTGSPKEMLWMGEYLSQRGYSVLGVRLAGHATRPEDMLRTRWQDWSASVEDGWHMLSKSCQQTFLAGLSMGGALCLLAATQLPAAGVVAMSTPYELPEDPRRRYIKLMYRLQPSLAKGPPDWHNPQAALDHVDYPSYPTRSILELGALLAEMRINLPKVKDARFADPFSPGSLRTAREHASDLQRSGS